MRITGNTTAVAFERHASMNKTNENSNQKYLNLLSFIKNNQEISPDKRKKLLRTSFLPEIHATDSTCIGCTPKIAATMKAIVSFLPNRIYMRKKTRIVFKACNIILLNMKGFAEIPFVQLLQVLSFKLRLRIVSGW